MATQSNTNTILDLIQSELNEQFVVLGLIADELENDLIAAMPVGTYSLSADEDCVEWL